VAEHRLSHDEVERDTEPIGTEIRIGSEHRPLEADLVMADFAGDRILDQPAIGFDAMIVTGQQIGDQQATNA
jgi:hypothetical protein